MKSAVLFVLAIAVAWLSFEKSPCCAFGLLILLFVAMMLGYLMEDGSSSEKIG